MTEQVVIIMRVLLFFCFLACGFSENPSYTPQCSRSDEECLTRVAKAEAPKFIAGFPDLQIETLDPFALNNYTVDLAGLMFTTTGTARGYRNVIVDRVAFDFKNEIFRLDCRVNMTLKGKYRAGGRLLFLPINGEGDIKIKAVSAVLNITAPFEVTEDSGSKQHLRFKDFDMKFDVTGYVHYTLTNLFNGNKELGEAMHNFLNTNWKLVSNEFASPVVRTGIELLFVNMNKLFAAFPTDNFFLD